MIYCPDLAYSGLPLVLLWILGAGGLLVGATLLVMSRARRGRVALAVLLLLVAGGFVIGNSGRSATAATPDCVSAEPDGTPGGPTSDGELPANGFLEIFPGTTEPLPAGSGIPTPETTSAEPPVSSPAGPQTTPPTEPTTPPPTTVDPPPTTPADGWMSIQQQPIEPLAPGLAPTPLIGTITNHSTETAWVTQVRVTITAVTKAPDAVDGPCDASDYLVLAETMPVDQPVPPGGTIEFKGAWIGFNNKSTNQDACKGATLSLSYVSN